MKRLLAAVISAVLLCPMTAFAGQTAEAQAVYQELMAKTQSVSDQDAYYDLNMTMSGSMFKELGMDSIHARMEMNTKIKQLNDPANMQYLACTRMTMLDMPAQTATVYYANGWYYMDSMGQKIKFPMPLDKMVAEISGTAEMFETSPELLKDLSVRTEGENRILSYTMDDSKMNEYMSAVLAAAGMDSLLEGMTFTVKNVGGDYTVTPEGYYTHASVRMDMEMSMDGETVSVKVDGSIGVANPGQPVDFPVPNPREYQDASSND